MSDEHVRCPHCGAAIGAKATFCRHCGGSDSDAWRDEGEIDTDIDDFDYEQFVDENFSERVTNTQTPTLWRFVAVMLLLLFALSFLLL